MNVQPRMPVLMIGAALLSACSSGGSTRSPAPSAPSAPPSAPARFDPCPDSHVDCVVSLPSSQVQTLLPMDSSRALRLENGGELRLEGEYRFDAGTRVERGRLTVGAYSANGQVSRLFSDVHVAAGAQLVVAGMLHGQVDNHGYFRLWETVHGDVANAGQLHVSAAVYDNSPSINGDFSQAAGGELRFALAPQGWDSPAPLRVQGQARLDGTLTLALHTDDWGPYPPPARGRHTVLQAEGGVSGQFAQWRTQGLFIQGNLGYGPGEVWLDIVRADLDQAMQQAGPASALAVASARNLQAVLDAAPAAAQARVLTGIAPLLWQDDPARAARAFESLAGHAHAGLGGRLHRQLATGAAQVDAQLAALEPAAQPLAWAAASAQGGQLAGSSLWLGPKLLAGVAASRAPATLPFEAGGGLAWGQASLAAAHLHYRGQAWQASAQLGAGHSLLQLQRPLDTGGALRHLARSQHRAEQAFVHLQVGRDLAWGGGVLRPLASLDYSRLRDAGFAELGHSGLELLGAPSRQAQLSLAWGARYSRQWPRLRLELEARRQHGLDHDGQAWARFRAAPEVAFALPGMPLRDTASFGLRLAGPLGRHWDWQLDGLREDGLGAARLGLARGF